MTDEEKIDAFIRERGVTLCPPAYAEGCTCEVPIVAVDFARRGERRVVSWVTD